MKYLITTLSSVFTAVALLYPRAVLFAITARGPSNSVGLRNPISSDSLADFFAKFLGILVQVGFPIIILAIIYTGFLFVKAQGNPEELQTAKRAFLWTIVGAIILLGASAISVLIQGTVNEISRP